MTLSKHATTVGHDPSGITVTYHQTVIVKASEAEIFLNFGHPDYVTKTTVKKMNQTSEDYSLGYRVLQQKGKIFVEFKGNKIPFNGTSLSLAR